LGRWLLCLVAGTAEVLLVHLPFDPWIALGPRPGAHRLYLWITFGAEGCGGILLATGAAGLALRATGAEGRPTLRRLRRLIRAAALAGIIVLPVLQALTILSSEPTLSDGGGIEKTLCDRFARLLAAKRRSEGRPVVPLAGSGDEARR